jgi:hypothetical protein
MTLPFVGMPQSLGSIDGPLGCFTAFFVCLDCGEIVTEYGEESHAGHEYYYVGSGEEAIEFLNDILKDALKCIFKEQRLKIIGRPRTPPLNFEVINERLNHVFDSTPYTPRVQEIDIDDKKEGNPKRKDKTTIDEKRVD